MRELEAEAANSLYFDSCKMSFFINLPYRAQ